MNHQENYYNASKNEVLEKLGTSDNGLTKEESQDRLAKFGKNQLESKKKISALGIFFSQFKNTLTLILIAATIVILFIYFFGEKDPSDLVEAFLIFGITLMIAILGFIQEYKAEKAVESLKKLLAFKAKVRRDGKILEIDVKELVPGDIVILEEGEKIPADIRILNSYSIYTNEASLTGESTTIEKFSEEMRGEVQIADQKNMLFAGTILTSGRGEGVVVATGNNTQIGKIANLVLQTVEEQTPIQKRLDSIGKSLGLIIIGVCGVVFIFINFFASEYQTLPPLSKIIHSFIASVSLAVAAIPEGLPAVVTISLALGTQRMLKKNALVRKLNSVETLGSTDVICSDKTGTLTRGEMTVVKIFSNGKIFDVSGVGYKTEGDINFEGKSANLKDLELILTAGLNCNNSSIGSEKNIYGDPTEAALIVSAIKGGYTKAFERVFEVPFSSERKMMTAVVKDQDRYLVFSKGAPEVVLERSESVFLEQIKPLTNDERKKCLEVANKMSEEALRNLGLAYKEISQEEYQRSVKNPPEFEKGLIFLGLQGMIDPPREEIPSLIKSCKEAGIRVIMITGDHIETAKAIAKQIGIESGAVSGSELEGLSEEKLKEVIKRTDIYARINPSFKMRIVKILQDEGHIVAMTGDGVNDAPALKRADIGIAMGITGTDVAKESSDMVLLDDKFSTIVSAIEEGRGIFQNIQKFVNYLLSCNIAEVLLVFLSLIIFQDLPLTATMLLWINVVTDGLPAIALGLDQPQDQILKLKPSAFQTDIINKKTWIQMGIFAVVLTAAVMGIYYLNLKEGNLEAKGAAFTAIVFFELVQLYIIRSNYSTKLFSNFYLFLAILVSIILQIAIVYIPMFYNLFEVRNIDLFDWGYIFIVSIVLLLVLKAAQKILNDIYPVEGVRVLN